MNSLSPELAASRKWKIIFWLIAIILAVAMPVMSRDFGVTWDEWVHAHFGQLTLRYFFTGGTDQTCLTGGEVMSGYRLQYYGHLFDTLATLVYGLVSGSFHQAVFQDIHWSGFYETRHAVNALFGFIAMLYAGLLAKELGGWRAGVLALGFVFLSPRFLGHSMNNPKDIPFAAVYIFSIYHMIRFLRGLPDCQKKTSAWLALGVAASIAVRIGGLLLIVYLWFFSAAKLLYRLFRKEECRTISVLAHLIVISVLAYAGGLLLWPYGLVSPIAHPLAALREMSQYPLVLSVLFDGKTFLSSLLPWYYLPKWIAITTPLFVLIGLAGFFIFLFRSSFRTMFSPGLLLAILTTSVFPITYIILKKSALYDEWRHVLFVYPPLVVLAALAWEFVFRFGARRIRIALSAVLILLASGPAFWIARNHPHEYVYFNRFVGGLDGAFGRYETDYWGNSLRMASEWLADEVKKEGIPHPIIVSADGSTMQNAYYLKPKLGAQYVPFQLGLMTPIEWDYGLVLSRNWPPEDLNSPAWPPKGTIHTVKAGRTILCAVVKNPDYTTGTT